MMLVFTEEWLKGLTHRYRNHKGHSKPFIYFVAVEDEFKSTREQIEKWVALLPAGLQKKVIASLQSDVGFQQTYHELAVGSLISGSGLQLTYERDFDGLTPDWFVSAGNGLNFIVEVFSENVSQTTDSLDARLGELQSRISELPFDFALSVDIPFDWNSLSLDSGRSKIIAKKVKDWLASDNPQIGTELHVDEFSFEVILRDRKYAHVMLMGFGRSFWVNPEPLRRNIETKIDKYKKIALANKFPFLVAVVAEFRTGYDLEGLEDILFGKEVFDIAIDNATSEAVEQTTRRKNDGLFVKKPLLSGVIWASKPIAREWQMRSYLNPHAQFPLPEKSFG
jgi:hypothetical protein